MTKQARKRPYTMTQIKVHRKGLVNIKNKKISIQKSDSDINVHPDRSCQISVNTANADQDAQGAASPSDGYYEVYDQPEVWLFVHLEFKEHTTLANGIEVYTMNDFDTQTAAQSTNAYIAVLLIKLSCKTGSVVVACCSKCFSKQLIGFYCLGQHEDSVFGVQDLFGCVHSTAAVQHHLQFHGQNCSIRNDESAMKTLCQIMQPYSGEFSPGWFVSTKQLSKRGMINVYLNDEYRIHVLGAETVENETIRYFCFQCSKFGCHHCSTIVEHVENTVKTIHKIYIPPPPLNNLVSKEKYPCMKLSISNLVNVSDDTELCTALCNRRIFAANWWIETFPNTFANESAGYSFFPETNMCCDEMLEMKLKSNSVQLFTLAFFPTFRCRIYSGECTKCDKTYCFDGRSYGILNFNNYILIDIGNH